MVIGNVESPLRNKPGIVWDGYGGGSEGCLVRDGCEGSGEMNGV